MASSLLPFAALLVVIMTLTLITTSTAAPAAARSLSPSSSLANRLRFQHSNQLEKKERRPFWERLKDKADSLFGGGGGGGSNAKNDGGADNGDIQFVKMKARAKAKAKAKAGGDEDNLFGGGGGGGGGKAAVKAMKEKDEEEKKEAAGEGVDMTQRHDMWSKQGAIPPEVKAKMDEEASVSGKLPVPPFEEYVFDFPEHWLKPVLPIVHIQGDEGEHMPMPPLPGQSEGMEPAPSDG